MTLDRDPGRDRRSSRCGRRTPRFSTISSSHSLEWPSLTLQFLPSPPLSCSLDTFSVHKLLLGTHTSDRFQNYLMVADGLLPRNTVTPPEQNPTIPEVEITKKIRVDGEVNRARCMPQKPDMVAAKTSGLEVYVFDCRKRQTGGEGGSCNPDLRLRGHEKEGYGLSWSPFKEGYVLSGSNDCKVCLWDVSASAEDKMLDAMHVYLAHENAIEDVSWHLKDENLFGSVGDDCRLMIWNLRLDKPQHFVVVHEKEVNFLSLNPYIEWILATASSDTTVGLFDIWKLNSPLLVFSSHTEEVFQVEWDPLHETVLASSADDWRLMVWDLNRIGEEQSEGDAADGPPELLFSHGGHKARISDFSWNKNDPWVISSVAEDNGLRIWQMADSIYRDKAAADYL